MKTFPLPLPTASSSSQQEQGYLQVRLNNEIQALIPITQAKEAVVVSPEKITIMPNMSQWVIGLFNQRSRVFWVIDLPNLLQLSAVKLQRREYSIVIIQVGKIPLALVVEEIQGVIRFSEDKIQPLIRNYSPGLTPYVTGCVLQPPAEMLLVLEPQSIIQEAIKMMS